MHQAKEQKLNWTDDPTQKLAHHFPALPENLRTKLLLPATAYADLALTATAEMTNNETGALYL
jgi:hypothetical protein